MEKIITTFADRIKEGLQLKEMSPAKLSNISGVSRPSISNYMSGRYEPNSRTIYKIAKALDVCEAWLMGYDVSPERVPDEMRKPPEKDEIMALLYDLKENPEKRMLFSVLEGATKEDILKAVAIIEALKKTNI